MSRESPRERANYNPRWAQLIARARPSSTLPIKASIASSRQRNPDFYFVPPPLSPFITLIVGGDNCVIVALPDPTFPRSRRILPNCLSARKRTVKFGEFRDRTGFRIVSKKRFNPFHNLIVAFLPPSRSLYGIVRWPWRSLPLSGKGYEERNGGKEIKRRRERSKRERYGRQSGNPCLDPALYPWLVGGAVRRGWGGSSGWKGVRDTPWLGGRRGVVITSRSDRVPLLSRRHTPPEKQNGTSDRPTLPAPTTTPPLCFAFPFHPSRHSRTISSTSTPNFSLPFRRLSLYFSTLCPYARERSQVLTKKK